MKATQLKAAANCDFEKDLKAGIVGWRRIVSCETSQLDQNCEGENNLLIADMEAVLKKMKALRVEKDNVSSQVNSRYDISVEF